MTELTSTILRCNESLGRVTHRAPPPALIRYLRVVNHRSPFFLQMSLPSQSKPNSC